MKKYFLHILLCIIFAVFSILNNGQALSTDSKQDCKIYFVDRQLHRLIPTSFPFKKNPEKTAEKIISQIICGKDQNTQILRLIPNIKDCVTVQLRMDTAYVNLSSEILQHINKNVDLEKLTIYQIVNSLTSIDEIQYVRFTIDGETKKDFLGFLDMREIFTADYDI